MADPNDQSDDIHSPEPYLSIVLGKLMETPKFSDLKFVCEGQEIKVHKAIVCTQSPVIDKSANNEFFVEAHEGRIEMDNFDLPTVKRMVEFMYTGTYSVTAYGIDFDTSKTAHVTESEEAVPHPASEEAECTTSLEILKRHVRVKAIAEYYDIPRLRDVASHKIKGIFAITGFSTNIFLGVLKEARETTGDIGLYQILASAAANHLGELLFDDKFGALDIMKDEFGGCLLFACAQLTTATNNALKTERELHQQAKSELAGLQNQKEADKLAIESFVEQVKGQRVCQDCSSNLGCTVTWYRWSGPSSLSLCCRQCGRRQ